MFRFHFVPETEVQQAGPSVTAPSQDDFVDDFRELVLSELLVAIPPVLSYSTIAIDGTDIVLPRRDLFDVRFQLISHSEGAGSTLDYVDAPSDLVPGVYEGGLKTWECSIDLAGHLSTFLKRSHPESITGKRFLEIGCGTALPSLYLLHELFRTQPNDRTIIPTEIHLQDYNRSAIELMTLPNIFLTWYLSPAASAHRITSAEDAPISAETQYETRHSRPDNEVEIFPELIESFLHSLHEFSITLRLFSGSWSAFARSPKSPLSSTDFAPFDIAVTSETIYNMDSLPSLLTILRLVTRISQSSASADLSETGGRPTLCLVAAKVLYFGVGGGIMQFIQMLESQEYRGKAQTVWEQDKGVSRKILKVEWMR